MLALDAVVRMSHYVHGIVLLGASPTVGPQSAVLGDEGSDRQFVGRNAPARRITDKLFSMCESLAS